MENLNYILQTKTDKKELNHENHSKALLIKMSQKNANSGGKNNKNWCITSQNKPKYT